MPRCRLGPLTLCPSSPSRAQIFVSKVVISCGHDLWLLAQGEGVQGQSHYVSAMHMHMHSVAMEAFFIFWSFLILLSVLVPMAMFIM